MTTKQLVCIILIIISLFLSSWYVLHGEILFHTDIARDFLLLNEIENKKIVLLGPRASGLDGLFHGPLWLYLNYPAYYLGNGNPVIVGLFWVLLTIISLLLNFIIAKKLFNKTTAYLYTLLLSVQMISFVKGLYNPFGAMFLISLFFYLFLRYKQTLKLKYLISHLFTAGLIIQFQMAVGVPLLVLSSIYIIYVIIKNKKLTHLFSYLILLIPLSTFIVFDIRHGFSQLNAVIGYIMGRGKQSHRDWTALLTDRLHMMTIPGLYFFKGKLESLNIIPSYLMAFFLYLGIINKKNKLRRTLMLFLYFYIGFYLLTTLHNGWLLIHYWLPMISLVFLIFSFLVAYLQNKVLYIIFFLIVIINLIGGISDIKQFNTFSGKDENSWRFQEQVTKTLFTDAPLNFGLYIFSPDILAYQTKAAFVYEQKVNPFKKANINEKKSTTYIIAASPPKDKPYMNEVWWISNKVKIDKKPSRVFSFTNGYKIIKYELDEKELMIPSDPDLNDWLHYR